MKKFAILSPMVILMASTSLAQDSCIIRPSCADMGYTKTESECEGKDSIKCPFDLTALFCPEGGTSSSEPETLTCDFGYLAKNGECTKIDNAIAFVLSVNAANGGVTLYTGTSSGYIVDWGDGTIDNSLSTNSPSHVYTDVGEYQIVITGNVSKFYIKTLTNSYPTRILNVDLDTVKTYGSYSEDSWGVTIKHPFNNCSHVTGEIPDEISPNLKTAIALFDSCSGLTGEIPTLPNTITNAYDMFYGCTGLTGSIPNLPSSLTNAHRMFFNCSGLTGEIPTLPNTITDGYGMFRDCTGLTGNIPTLPTSLEDGTLMFGDCSGLTGTFPSLPSSLVSANSMFSGCSGVSGSISSFPSGLQEASYMFKNTKLSGVVPNLPTGLSSAKEMFYDTNITKIPSNLGSLTALKDGSYMFYKCESMAGTITGFPPNLEQGDYMFYRCFPLSGAIPDLPVTLKTAEYMFFNDYYLTSLPSNLGNLTNLTRMSDMFRGCSKLSGEISLLPPNVNMAQRTFKGLKYITGFPSNLGALTNLYNGDEMFNECTQISGVAPEYTPLKNAKLSFYTDIFAGTQVTNNTSDPWPDKAW